MQKTEANEDQMQQASISPVKAYPTQVANPEVHYYLYTEIASPDNYVELIHDLDNAGEGEVVHLHLCTPGGDLNTAICLVHAISRSNAHIVCHADGQVASAGICIFLACNQWEIQSYSNFMSHDGAVNGTFSMKLNENKKMTDFVSDLYRNLLTDTALGVFSEDEIEKILDGSDVYVHGEDMIERLKACYQEQAETEEV